MGNTAQFESLRSIHAHYRWGLTGTPPTRDLSQVAEPFRTEAEKAAEMLVATLAQIFHLGHLPLEEKPPSAYRTDLAQETEKERPKEMCQHFLDHFARQNTSEEVTVDVERGGRSSVLVVECDTGAIEGAHLGCGSNSRGSALEDGVGMGERAIYLQCSRDVSDASGALTDEDRAERLIKLCSHFAAYCGLATAAADATGECHRIISTKQERRVWAEHAKKTYNVALQRAVQLELLWQRPVVWTEDQKSESCLSQQGQDRFDQVHLGLLLKALLHGTRPRDSPLSHDLYVRHPEGHGSDSHPQMFLRGAPPAESAPPAETPRPG
ncbi:unnamed protein product [Durusdinium trenchii]|uniref:Uncharacterized protein n=1 Tax=Durusdinium trenchii TaxID=1381693 RepID=A0ABP0N3R1_9DINO